jgi:hypothetical protein
MSRPDDWLIARWQRNGFPTLVRMATAYRDLGHVPGYEHKIVVVMTLRSPQPSGMPGKDEHEALNAAELSICNMLEAENESLCVLAITGCGTRDLIFYTRSPNQAQTAIAKAKALIASHEIDAAVEPDKEWELYGFFNRALAASPAPTTQN